MKWLPRSARLRASVTVPGIPDLCKIDSRATETRFICRTVLSSCLSFIRFKPNPRPLSRPVPPPVFMNSIANFRPLFHFLFRYKTAQLKLVDIMHRRGAGPEKPILRQILREEARKDIGDTGLLDHLLKVISTWQPIARAEALLLSFPSVFPLLLSSLLDALSLWMLPSRGNALRRTSNDLIEYPTSSQRGWGRFKVARLWLRQAVV